MNRPRHILPAIVLAQCTGTTPWFAANAVIEPLLARLSVAGGAVGDVTAAVQLGFIAGTLVFALLAVSDRYSARAVFVGCALAGAACNALALWPGGDLASLLAARFATGFFLAGIYPVGMKIAASWYPEGLGRALGYLVGALVLGTATPHGLKALGANWSAETVILSASALAVAAGAIMAWLVPDGPALPRAGRLRPAAVLSIFRHRDFRASAFGYFGHMWELYTLWAFLPVWLAAYARHHGLSLQVPAWSFAVIAAGSLGSVIGGLCVRRLGSARVAAIQLAVSGTCCALSPWLFDAPPALLFVFLFAWGVTVVGDSPQLSTLNAVHAPRQYVGSALTLGNAIGFALTIPSLYAVEWLASVHGPRHVFWLLLPGPLLALLALRRLLARPVATGSS